MKRVTLLITILLMSCGKSNDDFLKPVTLDGDRCPIGKYGLSSDTVTFIGGNQLTVQNGYCHSSGIYACSKDARKLTLQITAAETGTGLESNCLGTGTYQCSYYYGSKTNAVPTTLFVTCEGDNKLNPTKTYETLRND